MSQVSDRARQEDRMPKLHDIVWYGRYGVQVVNIGNMTDSNGYCFQRGYVKIWAKTADGEAHAVDTALTVANARRRIAKWRRESRNLMKTIRQLADGDSTRAALQRLADK